MLKDRWQKRRIKSALCGAILTGLILSAGCAQDGIKPLVLPHLATYSDEFQDQAADELSELPLPCARDVVSEGCSAIHRLVDDYGVLREKIRQSR